MAKKLILLTCLFALAMAAGAEQESAIRVRSIQQEKPVSRARRLSPVVAVIENSGNTPAKVKIKLVLPPGMEADETNVTTLIKAGKKTKLTWAIEADEAVAGEVQLQVKAADTTVASASLPLQFLQPVKTKKPSYIPEPAPVQTPLLIGAHNCPLWEADKFSFWDQVLNHPERTPVLGFYAQENPEVADWETKWAVEHGISFFIYCWYRDGQGGAIKTRYGSAIHDALLKSKFADKMKFTIMWENGNKGHSGVTDENDLLTNLLPYWIENYFKHASYLKVDNKPLLFIYRPDILIADLGGIENVKTAFGKMRQACRNAGFDGLYLLGQNSGLNLKGLEEMKQIGLDYAFAYHWQVPDNPQPEQAIRAQMEYIGKRRSLGFLPEVVTVSQGWSGWRDEGSIWKIPPSDYENLLRQAKDFIATMPANELGSKMLLLDNWNEWGEGHYIAPHREFGFGYLDAVRRVFATNATEPHVDLIPEDIGFGPYDTAFRTHAQREAALDKLVGKKISKGRTPEAGLVAWWSFDEDMNSPVAFDGSGHGLGGKLRDIERAPGIDGNALDCRGGAVEVADNRALTPMNALTLECWVKTDVADQKDTWFVNSIGGSYGYSSSTGFRFGLVGGKPCFEIPVTKFSHHLLDHADLPLGRWVHLAGTFDGKIMRLYVDGEERGTLERPFPLKPSDYYLCLGNYNVKHDAHFTGLLDEVKLFDRALSPEEVRAHYQSLSKPD